MLGFQGDAIALAVGPATCAPDRAGEVVAAVDLDPRFSGQDAQGAATFRIVQGGGLNQRCIALRPVEHEVVIDAKRQRQLRMILPRSLAKERGSREVERSALDRSEFASWRQPIV